MTAMQLYKKLDLLPDNLKKEVDDFIDFLVLKSMIKKSSHKPKFGSAKGFYKMSDDFDEPLEDFKDYMI